MRSFVYQTVVDIANVICFAALVPGLVPPWLSIPAGVVCFVDWLRSRVFPKIDAFVSLRLSEVQHPPDVTHIEIITIETNM